jgi:fatty acid desaturase
MRPTAAQVMRNTVIREDRKRKRRQHWAGVFAQAAIVLFVALGTILIAIN